MVLDIVWETFLVGFIFRLFQYTHLFERYLLVVWPSTTKNSQDFLIEYWQYFNISKWESPAFTKGVTR